jgi:dolichol-phosphate mannosyltransferase
MVIGSRYAPGGSTPGWSRKRRLMSRAASACAWPLTDVHDALSGFFAVRRELLAEIPSDAAGFKIALEILVRGGDSLRAGEVPIAFRDRELGQSKMGAGVIFTYFQRLLALSGWRESHDTVRLALAKTLMVWAVDLIAFTAVWLSHAGLSAANLVGFAAGGTLNAWLKVAQSSPEVRKNPKFLYRLPFVSLMALFLRSGVLGTLAGACSWPAITAIVPAIIAGWVVLFLGYALFIWPVREQYGRGVRWRVAAIGASAYLLALRVVYLYAMPISARIAVMQGAWAAPGVHKPVSLRLVHLGIALLGPGRAGYNLPAILCWAVGAWAMFNLAHRLFDKTVAFRTLLLFSVLPVFFWTGSVFGPETVYLTAWALWLWFLTWLAGLLGLFKKPAAFVWLNAMGGGLFLTEFYRLPWQATGAGLPVLVETLLFVPWQVVLVTPVAVIATVQLFRPRGPNLILSGVGICSACAAFASFVAWISGNLDITISSIMWLPILPFIASEMQRPGEPRARFWGPVIFLCILCYGLYFYWLAFGG